MVLFERSFVISRLNEIHSLRCLYFFLSLSYFVTNTHKIRNFVTPAQRSTHMPTLEPHPCSPSLAWGWAGNRLKTSDFSSPYCSWSCFLFSLWSVKALSQMQVVFLPLHYAEPFLSGSFEDALRPLLRAPLNLIDCGNIEFLPLVITLLYSSCVPCPAFRTLYPPFHSLRSHDLLVTVAATVVWGLGGCAAAASLRE